LLIIEPTPLPLALFSPPFQVISFSNISKWNWIDPSKLEKKKEYET